MLMSRVSTRVLDAQYPSRQIVVLRNTSHPVVLPRRKCPNDYFYLRRQRHVFMQLSQVLSRNLVLR
jgi:hypothetical protein